MSNKQFILLTGIGVVSLAVVGAMCYCVSTLGSLILKEGGDSFGFYK